MTAGEFIDAPTSAEEDRTLPHNLEAERSVLGAVIVDNPVLPFAAQVLEPADFYRPGHRLVFAAMLALSARGSAIDFVTLNEELTRTGHVGEAGGIAYVASLADGVPRGTNVKYYAAIVKAKARLRAAIFAGNAFLTRAYEEDDLDTVVDETVRELLRVSAATDAQVVTIGQAATAFVEALDNEGALGAKTAFTDVDDVTGGLPRGAMTILAARPSVGKTTLAMNIAENVAASGAPVGVFTLEMSATALGGSALSAHAQVDNERIKVKALGDRDWSRIAHSLEALADRPLFLIEGTQTVTQIGAWMRRLRDERGCAVFIVDYLQLVTSPGHRNRHDEVSDVSRALTAVARTLNVAVVALAQLSRDPEKRQDKRPMLSDLRESGSLEQDAHIVMLLYRDDMYNKDPNADSYGTVEVIVAKNRGGRTGVARLAFVREQSRFANLAVNA